MGACFGKPRHAVKGNSDIIPTPPYLIELKDILLTTTLPVHSLLAADPHLFISLIEDENIYAETPVVNGDLATGVWKINSSLSANPVKQSVTLAVFASREDVRTRLVSVTLSVSELLERLEARPDGYQEFNIKDSESSMQLVMTCRVEVLPSSTVKSPTSHADIQDDHAVANRTESSQSDHEPDSSEPPSREFLESFYAKVARLPDHDEQKARGLSMLGHAYHILYQKESDEADLDKALSLHEDALQCIGPAQPQLAKNAHSLSLTLIGRFEQSGDIVDLERAISYLQNALNLTDDGDIEKPDRLSDMGSAFRLRFNRLGDLSDIQKAISFLQWAVDMTADGDPDEPGRRSHLGVALESRFGRLGSLKDLEDAISNQQRVVELTPDDHPSKPSRLNNLGVSLRCRFDRLGGLQDLEDAISNQRTAVELTPDGDPNKSIWLNNLSIKLRCRFEHLGDLKDLDDAISNIRRAAELAPDGDPSEPARLGNLGNALKSRFRRLGTLEDLEDAISSQRRAVELTPDGHPYKPGLLGDFGDALQLRFGRLGSLEDLEEAVSTRRIAITLTPDGHPDKPGRLNNLGIALQRRFERLGSLEDLEDAISTKRMAVTVAPDGHPNIPSWLNNLGTAFQLRFERLGGLKDLEDAISNQRRAVELTLDGHPNKSRHLSCLSNALRSRFERLDNLEDLEGAISNQQRGVELTPDGHPEKPLRLNILGIGLQHRFVRLGNLEDLEGSISNRRKATELMPNGHPDKPALLTNFGTALAHRFGRLGNLEDLEDAISNRQWAVKLTPEGHPDKPALLFNLGGIFMVRWGCCNILSDLDIALSAFSSAANSLIGSAMWRFRAARAWAEHSEAAGRSPLEAFRCAIDLLPRIAWLGLAVTDQHALLADVGGIVRDAVSAAIRYEEYETAVVWAEQGRSIVWQNLLGLRTPVDKLRQNHPEMADQLQHTARQLDGSGSQDVNFVDGQTASVSASHSKLAIEWDNLIDKIRKIPGLEGFLRAKSFHELAPAAHEGPVVILNINDSHCDALVLIAEDSAERRVSAINIPLERFSHEKAKKLFHNLTELLSSAGVRERNDRKTGRALLRADSDAKFKVILRVLWKDVVKPVIDGLAFQTQSGRPPRIWWCATGLLAFLPIHAAGLYDTQEIGERVSDFVVSSYAPTLNSILESSDPVAREDFQILTVAQASAPGAQPIPKTEDEVKIVQKLTTGARALNLKREEATVQRVRAGMMESNWIHLACHGQQDPDDPMSSGFLLHDDKLKLSEIVKMLLPKAEFAFLSACQTAMGDEKVAEESVHLAAGMLLSGCRGIIATTWSIRDDDAPKIAQEVYSRMFKDGKSNRKEAAYALHEAVKLLRESGADCVSWVPFIHIGR